MKVVAAVDGGAHGRRRVLLVSHFFPPDPMAGVQRVVESLAHDLACAGHEVSVLARRHTTAPEGPRLFRGWLPDGSQIFRLAGEIPPNARFLVGAESLERLFEEVLTQTDPDIVHFHHLLHHSPRLVEIAHGYGAAVVASMHDYYFACPVYTLRKPDGSHCAGPAGGAECSRACFREEGEGAFLRWGLRAAYFRRLLRIPERVISPSNYVARYFGRYGVPSERLRVIPNPTLARPARNGSTALARSHGEIHLAYLGSVVPHKGPHVILDALRVARIRSVRLSLFGSEDPGNPIYGRDLAYQAARIPGLTLEAHGAYELADLGELLRDVDCVVVPSQWQESYGIVAREALALGIPVIVARVGGLAEAVVDGVNGFTFAHDRPGELAVLLERLAADDALVERLRQGARASRVVTSEEHGRAVRAVYDEAIAAREARDDAAELADRDEREFLYEALGRVGFAGPREADQPQAGPV